MVRSWSVSNRLGCADTERRRVESNWEMNEVGKLYCMRCLLFSVCAREGIGWRFVGTPLGVRGGACELFVHAAAPRCLHSQRHIPIRIDNTSNPMHCTWSTFSFFFGSWSGPAVAVLLLRPCRNCPSACSTAD